MAIGASASRPSIEVTGPATERPASGPGPYRGMTATVPPASIPLAFLLMAGFGLIAFGVATAAVAKRIVSGPTALPVVGAVHFGMLAFLSTAVVGALHQFVPVITASELRSVRVARVTLVMWIAGVWLLPAGLMPNITPMIVLGGAIVVVAACLSAWNFSGPLLKASESDSVTGLRSAVAYLVVTVSFGIVYAIDLHHGWFGLLPHRVLAHASLGLLGWIGLSYVAVAEKLWPMFLLSHKEKRGVGRLAVRIVPAGVLLLALGLLFAIRWLGLLGGAVTLGGLAFHVGSFVGWVQHRKRKLELLHAFVISSMAFMVLAATAGLVAELGEMGIAWRIRVASTSVAAAAMWVALAVIGHSHKIVPFITWTTLRKRGISKKPDGKPVLFGDLFSSALARASFGISLAAGVSLIVGILGGMPVLIATGGVLLAACGVLTTSNLALWPRVVVRSIRDAEVKSDESS
ncbi:MAG: hypothetical protein DCC49_04925 [Acidobacteria bacterium]|nr:MAG: hypothetical protein DCC49_04925 [Acidobacteriota bacterium]